MFHEKKFLVPSFGPEVESSARKCVTFRGYPVGFDFMHLSFWTAFAALGRGRGVEERGY